MIYEFVATVSIYPLHTVLSAFEIDGTQKKKPKISMKLISTCHKMKRRWSINWKALFLILL